MRAWTKADIRRGYVIEGTCPVNGEKVEAHDCIEKCMDYEHCSLLAETKEQHKPPYSFEADTIYKIEVLEGKRWVTKAKGKPTLKMMLKFQKIMNEAQNSCRLRKRLPNGVYFGSCMASDHMAFINAAIRYLKHQKAIHNP